MINKYRVHEVAKDFDCPSKEILDIVTKHFEGQKKSMTALEEPELDVIFEIVTQENSVESFDAYFATANEPKKEEKKEKKAAYRSLIRAELADELYDKILNIVVVQKKYKDPNYSAKDLAKELKTNTRYLSAVVNSRFGMNYSCLLNEYRIKDALHLLVDKRYMDKNVEEISAMVGFANRQSFYAAFYKNVGETPNGYRKRKPEKK